MGSQKAALLILVACLGISVPVRAGTVFLNFEDLPDAYFFSSGGENIGNFYSGVTFGPYVTGLSVTRFGGYDDAAYPPHSGDVVVWSAFDDPMTLVFDSPQSVVSFWFTSLNPITMTAYDSGANSLGSVTGDANTDGATGTSSFLEFDGAGIASVAISSAAGQYVMDDLTFASSETTVPEPGSVVLIATALCLVFAWRHGTTGRRKSGNARQPRIVPSRRPSQPARRSFSSAWCSSIFMYVW
jgi:hypothetical protein